jgi:hypothetical protein
MRSQLPTPFAQRAFDTGLALAAAKTAQERRDTLKTAALGALASNLPAVPGIRAIPAAVRPIVSTLPSLPSVA